VTAVGAVSALALNADLHFQRLLTGDCGVEPLTGHEYGNFPPILNARVKDFDRRQFIPDRMLRKLLSPSPAYALAAATEALKDSGADPSEYADCGLYVGSVCLDANPEALIPALRESVNTHNQVDIQRFATHGMKLVDPLFLVKSLPNGGLCAIAIQHQVLGPNANVTNGAVSGLQAVIAAFQTIRYGRAHLALAGGYDSLLQMDCIVDHLLAGKLARLKQRPECSCRPFAHDRDGYAIGEGAAFLMLESLEHALQRGAHIYGELRGFGQATQPCRLVGAAGNDQALGAAVSETFSSSGVRPKEVDAVFGDGMALPEDDQREERVWEQFLAGSDAVFTAATPAIGFCGAASGVFSLAHALLAIDHQLVPPTINCDQYFAGCLPVACQQSSKAVRSALVWKSDCGSKNAAILVSRYDG
jgi:3-oxoacyl-[acyl-carrier-protein] synthase II